MRYEQREPEQPWSWRRVLNGMRPETLERVVGPGIIGICCKPIHGSYDQARRHAAKVLKIEYAADAPVPLLDFVVFRADGTAVRFHPSQTTTKINISDAAAAFETEGPSRGKGKSDGRGTYRRMEANNYQERGALYNPNPTYPAAKCVPKARSQMPNQVASLALDPPAVAGDALEHIGGQARGSEEPPPPPPVRPPPGLPTTGPPPPPPPPSEFDLVD